MVAFAKIFNCILLLVIQCGIQLQNQEVEDQTVKLLPWYIATIIGYFLFIGPITSNSLSYKVVLLSQPVKMKQGSEIRLHVLIMIAGHIAAFVLLTCLSFAPIVSPSLACRLEEFGFDSKDIKLFLCSSLSLLALHLGMLYGVTVVQPVCMLPGMCAQLTGILCTILSMATSAVSYGLAGRAVWPMELAVNNLTGCCLAFLLALIVGCVTFEAFYVGTLWCYYKQLVVSAKTAANASNSTVTTALSPAAKDDNKENKILPFIVYS